MSALLDPASAGRQAIAAAGGRPSIAGISDLVDGVKQALETADVAQRKTIANTLVVGALVGGGAISLVDIGADFFDFGIGQALAQILSPFIRRVITEPVDDWLEDAFRYGSLNPNMFLRPALVEAFTEADLMDSMVDSGFKDKEIAKVLKVRKHLAVRGAWERWILEDKAAEVEALARARNGIQDLASEARSLRRELDDIEFDRVSLTVRVRLDGLKEQRREVLAEMRRLGKPVVEKVAPPKPISEGELRAGFLTDLLTRDDVITGLTALNYAAERIALLVSLWTTEHTVAAQKAAEQAAAA